MMCCGGDVKADIYFLDEVFTTSRGEINQMVVGYFLRCLGGRNFNANTNHASSSCSCVFRCCHRNFARMPCRLGLAVCKDHRCDSSKLCGHCRFTISATTVTDLQSRPPLLRPLENVPLLRICDRRCRRRTFAIAATALAELWS